MKPSDKACEDVTFELPDTVLKVLTREEIEALRIFGSAEYGFGTLPNGIEYLLTHTGLGFLALPDETAPRCQPFGTVIMKRLPRPRTQGRRRTSWVPMNNSSELELYANSRWIYQSKNAQQWRDTVHGPIFDAMV